MVFARVGEGVRNKCTSAQRNEVIGERNGLALNWHMFQNMHSTCGVCDTYLVFSNSALLRWVVMNANMYYRIMGKTREAASAELSSSATSQHQF